MSAKQTELYEFMSDISEQCYCAVWMDGNEYVLWEMVANPEASRRYGQDVVDDEDIEALRKLSSEAGGWILWRDDCNHPELPADEWGRCSCPCGNGCRCIASGWAILAVSRGHRPTKSSRSSYASAPLLQSPAAPIRKTQPHATEKSGRANSA
jgi:hypothetical protein